MTRAFSAVEMQSAGLAAWKAIIKMRLGRRVNKLVTCGS